MTVLLCDDEACWSTDALLFLPLFLPDPAMRMASGARYRKGWADATVRK